MVMSNSEPVASQRREYYDLETARLWAADSRTSEIVFSRLFDGWPEVHHHLAANESTPVHLLERLAHDPRPEVRAALADNSTAQRMSIRPSAPAPAANSVAAAAAASLRMVCSACGTYLTAEMRNCGHCGVNVRGWSDVLTSTSVLPTVAAAAASAQAASAPTASAPTAPMAASTPTASASAAPTPAPRTQSASADTTVMNMSRRDRWNFGRTVGPFGFIAFFSLVALLALGALAMSVFKTDTKRTTVKSAVPAAPSGTLSNVPASATKVAAAATTVAGATPQTAAVRETVTTPAAAVASAPAVTTARAVVTTARPIITAAAVPPTAALVGPSAATVTSVANLAQQYATALASKNADSVRSLNPAHTGDLSGYKYLDRSTVIPVTVGQVGTTSSYRTRLGLVAHESRPEGNRTVLYCAEWVVDVTGKRVNPESGRQVRTLPGYATPDSVKGELQTACK